MMRKKGDLLNIVGGVLLAVVCLLVVFGFAVKLYNIRTNQEDENAKKTLELLVSKLDLFQNEQSANITLQGFSGSENWVFAGWDKSIDTRLKPQKCFFESCLCICKDGGTIDYCQNNGYCRSFPNTNLKVMGYFAVEDTYVSTDYENLDKYPDPSKYVSVRSCIPLEKNLFELTVSKKANSLMVSKNITQFRDPKDLPACG